MSENTTAPTYAAVCAICKVFVARAHNGEMKGKARDRAALEFIVGANAGAFHAGNNDLCSHLQTIAFLVSVRGYSEVERLAKDAK